MALKFPCSECGQAIAARFLHRAEEAMCPTCGAEVVVPQDAEELGSGEQVAASDPYEGSLHRQVVGAGSDRLSTGPVDGPPLSAGRPPESPSEPAPCLPVSTTPTLGGFTITEYLGVVGGQALMGAHFFKDWAASFRDLVGGRSGAYESVAISVGGSLLMVCATGTAVKLSSQTGDSLVTDDGTTA